MGSLLNLYFALVISTKKIDLDFLAAVLSITYMLT